MSEFSCTCKDFQKVILPWSFDAEKEKHFWLTVLLNIQYSFFQQQKVGITDFL